MDETENETNQYEDEDSDAAELVSTYNVSCIATIKSLPTINQDYKL